MDLQLTDEQTLLAETVAELVASATGDDGSVPASSRDQLWSGLAEFGVVGAADDDGLLGAVELALVARALGERLAAVPFTGTAAFEYVVPARHGSVGLAVEEPSGGISAAPSTQLVDGAVTGEKAHVTLAASVDMLAVIANGGAPVIALVARHAPGVAIEDEPTLDPSLAPGRVRLDGVAATEAGTDVERLMQIAAVLASAEAVGAAAALLRLSTGYAGERRQFGRPISAFQALRHLLADLVVGVESSWSSVLYAAASLDERDPDLSRTVAVTKAWVSRTTLDVAHGCLQVFGGIAFTAEHPAHLFLRRIAALGGLYGSAADHERALGRLIANQLEVLT